MTLEQLLSYPNGDFRRRHIALYPGDDRLAEAARLLDLIAKGLPTLLGSDQHFRLDMLYRLYGEQHAADFDDIVHFAKMNVGLRSDVQCAEEFLDDVIEALEGMKDAVLSDICDDCLKGRCQ